MALVGGFHSGAFNSNDREFFPGHYLLSTFDLYAADQ
jgi:hypothetical protein